MEKRARRLLGENDSKYSDCNPKFVPVRLMDKTAGSVKKPRVPYNSAIFVSDFALAWENDGGRGFKERSASPPGETLLPSTCSLFALRGGAREAPRVGKLVDGWPETRGGGGGEGGEREEEGRRGADHAGRARFLPRQLGPLRSPECRSHDLREALRQLCLESGWSYAVFWRATGFGSQKHLICEDGYRNQKPGISSFKVSNFLHKEKAVGKFVENNYVEIGCEEDDRIISDLVDKIMASQVHFVGYGLVGQAASTGRYYWINKDNLDIFGPICKEDFADINCQLAAGMQTIAVVPVLPSGVIQLGSTKMVVENIAFVNHVKNLFSKLKCGSGDLQPNSTHKAFRGKSQMHSSSLDFGCQTADVCVTIDNKLPLTANGRNPEVMRSPAATSFNENFSAVSSQLNEKMQPGSLKVMSTKLTGKTTYPLRGLYSHDSEDIFPKSDEKCTHQVPDSNSGCQKELSILNSDLLSNNLKALEGKIVFKSAVEMLESKSLLSTSNKTFEMGNVSSTSKSYGIAGCSSSPAKLSLVEAPLILPQRSHLLRNPSISEVPQTKQPLLGNEAAHSLSNARAVKEYDHLVHAPCIYSESNVQVSCSDLVPGILQEYGFCYSKLGQGEQRHTNVGYSTNGICPVENKTLVQDVKEYKPLQTHTDAAPLPLEFASSNDLFHMLDSDSKKYGSNGSLSDVLVCKNSIKSCNLNTNTAKLSVESDAYPIFGSLNDHVSCSGLFSIDDSDQLLDAVISKINSGANQGSEDSASCKSSFADICSLPFAGMPNLGEVHLSKCEKDRFMGFLPIQGKTEPSCSSYSKSLCSIEKGACSQKAEHKSEISSLVGSCQSAKNDSTSDSNSKRVSELGKLNRKRPRPGESPRPRPKDRQMIQDRIKELRELVPNGGKCSIDALLEKTIKHMLFLQSVTKNADKLKVAGEPKISNEDGGILLKDNFEGGATWAFEVGTQPMTCPIVVEDLSTPRQMLVEMLCEERGSFLEIADFIRGLGLTILKGVMEARKNKVWARFAVEANRDVTRMEIFLSLIQLLETTSGSCTVQPTAGNINMPHPLFQQTCVPARVL